MIFVKPYLPIAVLLLISGIAFAVGSCPPNAPGCFMCGEPPTGVPCNRDCTAHSVPGLGYVSCELPQGEPPVCYCPYGGGGPTAGDDETLIANAQPCENPSGTCSDCYEIRASQGTVAIKRNGAWCIASAGIAVFPGDKVWVRNSAKARLQSSIGDEVDINSNSIFTIQSLFLNQPQGGVAKMIWREAQGIYHWFRSSDARPEQFEVTVNDVCTTPKGTEFIIEASSSQVTVKVLEGAVEVNRTGSSKRVTLNAGQYSTVPASGAPGDPQEFDVAATDRWWSSLESGGCCGSAFIPLLVPLLLAFIIRR